MQIKIVTKPDTADDFSDWEKEINNAIEQLENEGNKVTGIAWRDEFASIAYMTFHDLQEVMAARKGMTSDLIKDTMAGALGRQ